MWGSLWLPVGPASLESLAYRDSAWDAATLPIRRTPHDDDDGPLARQGGRSHTGGPGEVPFGEWGLQRKQASASRANGQPLTCAGLDRLNGWLA